MDRESLSVLIITGADLRRGAPGGTRSYVLGLIRYLAQRRISVGLVANGHPDSLPPGVTTHLVSNEFLPSTTAFQRQLRNWSGRVDFTRVGVLHFQRPDDLTAIAEDDLPPSICTLHGDSARGVRRRRGRIAGREYLRREASAMPRFRALVAVDDATAMVYRQRYPQCAGRVYTIPIAVGDHFLKARVTLPESAEPKFLFVGRLSEEKRIDLIIEAFRAASIPRARLQIAGTGPAAAELQAAAEGLAVDFLGPVPHEVLPKLLGEAGALVLASEFEGLPTVALEALASGCPVVAPAGCGLDSLLGDGRGILVQDVQNLGTAMICSLELRRSRRRISIPEQYLWSAVGRQIVELYRSVTGVSID